MAETSEERRRRNLGLTSFDDLLRGQGLPPAPQLAARRVSAATDQPLSFDDLLSASPPSFQQPAIGGLQSPQPGGPVQGFVGTRTGGIGENLVADFDDMLDGWKAIGSLISQEGMSGVATIAKALPGAIVDSYARWVRAAQEDRFLEMVQAHPLEFTQDALTPITILLSGGAAAAGTVSRGAAAAGAVGKGTTAAKVATILRRGANISNTLELGVDPLGAAGSFAIRKGAGVVANTFKGPVKTLPPRYGEMKIASSSDSLAPSVPTNRIDKVLTWGVDKFHPLKKIARQAGDQELRDAVQLFAGTSDRAVEMFENGPRNFGDLSRSAAPGLRQVLFDLGTTRKDDFDALLTARRSIELGERGIESGQGAAAIRREIAKHAGQEVPDQLTKQAFRALVNSGTFDPGMKKALEDWDGYTRGMVTYARDAGLIDDNALQAILRDNEFYAPALRSGFIDTSVGEGGQRTRAGTGTPIKRIKGSERAWEPPTDSMMLMTMRIVKEAEMNRIGQLLASAADNGIDGLERVAPPTGVAARVSPGEVLKALGVTDSARKVLADTVPTVDFDAPSPIFRGNAEKLPDNVLSFVADGKRQFVKMDDPDVAQAFASLRVAPQGDLMKLLSGPFKPLQTITKLQRAGVTREPGFGLVLNPARDQLTAFIQSNYGFIPGWDTTRGLFGHVLRRSQFYNDMRAAGAGRATLAGLDRPALAKSLKDSIRGGGGSWGAVRRNLFTNPLTVLQLMNETLEEATRTGAALRAFKTETAGGTGPKRALERAASEFRTITTDFAQSGASPTLRAIHSITAFQNARIQGLARAGQAFNFKADPKTAIRSTTKAMSLTVASTLLYMANRDDPEYLDTPQIERDLFWHVRLPNGVLARIPKPFELGLVFGTVPERFLESFEQEDPAAFAAAMKRVVAEFQPFDLPSGIKPVAENMVNRSFFFDAPLESTGLRRLVKVERANAGTTELSRVLSRWSSALSGPSTVRGKPSEGATLSPIQIDNLLFGFTGTLGRQAVRALDPLLVNTPLGTGVAPPEPRGGAIARLPVVSRLIANPGKISQARSDFFEINEALGQKRATFKTLTGQDKREFLAGNKQDIAQARLFSRTAQRMHKLFRKIKQVRGHPTLSPREKRKRIDILDEAVNRLAKQALDVRRQR